MFRLLIIFYFSTFVSAQNDDEMKMTAAELIRHWGYPVESHDVITADGYILNLLRIPHGRHNAGNSTCHRPAVLLVHGIFIDASFFVLNPPDSSPGMILADAGFDVFLLNVRGTTHSQRHIKLTKNDADFWKVDDMAKFDAPAAIGKALELTGATSLHWIGHSQGTLIGFFLLAEKPEYNSKVRTLTQLAPVGTVHWAKGVLRVLKMAAALFDPILRHPQEIGISNPWWLEKISGFLCPQAFNFEICKDFLDYFAGPSTKAFNWTRAPLYIRNNLVSTSSWTLLQYVQNSNRNYEYHFDISPTENLKRYGDIRAPPYNYKNIDTNAYLFWSRNDWEMQPQEIEKWLIPQMKNGVIKGTFEISDYNHVDYGWSTDVAERVYNRIIDIVRKYESNVCVY